MKLYMVEDVASVDSPIYYWAENEGDALGQHEAQGYNQELEWVASPVWANNKDLKYRGFVTQGGEQ